MILLIDAYNVLKQVGRSQNIDEADRNKFVKQLVLYSQKKRHKVVLVFDGGADDAPYREKVKNVYVVYSGYSQTADDYIKQYILDNKNKDILLVSYDRELRNFASKYSIDSIGSHEFYGIMIAALRVKNVDGTKISKNIIKTSQASNDELDQLMQSTNIEYKADDFVHENKVCTGSFCKVSKKERKIINKIKKL